MSEGEFYVTRELVYGLAADCVILRKYCCLGGGVWVSRAPPMAEWKYCARKTRRCGGNVG